jgi:hypothetical protein
VALVVLPFLVSAVATAIRGSGYNPISDYAMTELRVRDALHFDVLTGLYSRSDWNHPGPLLFYALAPFYFLTGHASVGMNLGALAINGLSVAGIAWLSWRRGGTVTLLCALLGCALVMRTMGADFLYDPWNNYVVTLPFGLLLFCIWSLAAGDRIALPVATVAASFLAQTHVGFVLLALPLLAIGATWLVVPTLRRGRDPSTRRRVLRMVLGCVVLGAVLWSPVIVDLLTNHPSNLERTYRYFDTSGDESQSLTTGWRIVTAQFGVAPEWLTTKRMDIVGYGESPFKGDAPVPLLLGLVALAGVYQWWKRREDDARLRDLAVVVGAALVIGIVAVMRTLGPALDYRLRWTWMLPLTAFVLVAATGWQAAVRRWPGAQRVLLPVVVAAIAVVSMVNVGTAATVPSPWNADSDVMRDLAPRVIDRLEPGAGQVVVSDHFGDAAWYTRALVLQLERAGIDVRVAKGRAPEFGANRVVDEQAPVQARLVVAQGDGVDPRLADPDLQLIARWQPKPRSSFAIALRARERLERAFARGELTQDELSDRVQEVLRGPPHVPVADDVAVFSERATSGR